MEIESGPLKSAPLFHRPEKIDETIGDPELSESRVKSSLRLNYEAQVRVIQHQIGGLEQARQTLGLSQRKMAQLLLVDPSAWTRWTRPEGEAPPHIWRALQWYLTLREKIPGLTPQYFVNSDPKVISEKTLQQIRSEKEERERQHGELRRRILELEGAQLEILLLREETRKLRRWNWAWFSLCLISGGLLAAWFLGPALP
ncbi:MAG: hypothetical protein KF789_12450 [Bdellovibrionaceae bacterium]|nr:hypothetical protein [Pseudobdellovibrionaceae bacterium]